MYTKSLRSTPCTECKSLRRKCIRLNLDVDCLRCEKRGKICQLEDEDEDLKSLESQVKQLEKTVAFMEEQLQIQRSYNGSSDDGTLVCSKRQPLSELPISMIQNLHYSWKVKIRNGTFQIETGIQNINELLQFYPSVTYLSPLGQYYTSDSTAASWSSNSSGYSDDTPSNFTMRFGGEGAVCLIPSTITICTKTRLAKAHTTTATMPLLLDPKALVDQLLDIYFHCHNNFKPLVHEPTHRAKLATIQDPLTDLVTLGICSYVCSAACKHLQLSLQERRTLGDYFHTKARDIIIDQFDQPDKRLETVMGINLLIEYMHMTFKFDECRQLLSMAIQLLLDLRNDYPELKAIGFKACFNGEPHYGNYMFTKDEGPTTNVDKMLFTRHVTISLWLNVLMDSIVTVGIAEEECFHFPIWEYIADEPEETKRFVRAHNWVINMYNHPFISLFTKQTIRVSVGKTCTLGLEALVILESVLEEWAVSLPAEFRLCHDLYDKDGCFKSIDQTEDFVILITFIDFHIFHVGTYSCLLQPKSPHDDARQQLLSHVQERSLQKALKSCQLALYAIHRLAMVETDSCSGKLYASDFLLNTLDALGLLALSPNTHITKEARPMMKSCLEELDTNRLAIRSQVQPNYSPYRNTLNVSELLNGGTFDVDYYNHFPHPWLEMMYDASRYITLE